MIKPKITIKNIWSRLDGLNEIIISALDKELSYLVPNAHFAKEHMPWWDGRIHLAKKVKGSTESLEILTGLTGRTIKFLWDNFKIKLEIEDTRIKPEKELFYEWNDEEYELRDYQLEAVENSIQKGRGVIEAATGSGKSILASKIINELGVRPFIFYVMSKELLYQAKKKLESSIIGIEVGIIGDGVCDIKEVNVMTIQTACTVYNIDIKKALKKMEDFDDSDLESIKKENMSHVEKSFFIKKLIEDCKGIFFDECLIKGTKVIKNDGSIINIEDVSNGDDVFIGNKISNTFTKKVDSILRIEHQCNTLETTETHPNFIIRSSKKKKNRNNQFDKFKSDDIEVLKSEDLKVGDFLLVPTSIPHSPKNHKLNYNMCRLISTIMCDGHVDNKGYRIKINISKDKDWFKEVFYSAMLDFDISEIKENIDYRSNLTIYTNDREFNSFITKDLNIPRGRKSDIIYVNNIIFESELDAIRGFIDGCFCSEGDVSKNRLSIVSTSERFIKDIQFMLLKFGIISTIRTNYKKNKKHKNSFVLSITGHYIKEYVEKIGISMDRKLNLAKDMMNDRKSIKLPRTVVFDNTEYYASKIKKIEKINGEFEVYDFTTQSHKFIANNTLTHNCHHCPSKTAENILKKSTNCYYFFGGSATPIRADNADLYIEGLFGRKLCNINASFLIRKGFLMKPDIYYIKLKGPGQKTSNYEQDVKENIVNNSERNNHIASIASSLAESGLSVLILVGRIEHGDILKDMIKDSVFVYSKTKNRKEIFEDLEEKKTKVVISSSLADEGLDIPTLNCVILAGGGKSPTKCKQRVGRAIRKTKGKVYSVIFDFIDIGMHTKKHSKVRKKFLEQEPEFNIIEISSFEKSKDFLGKNLF